MTWTPSIVAISLLCVANFGAQAQLAPPTEPPENPGTPEKVVVGKMLFWEEQLSSDNTVACGLCHSPASGGSSFRSTRTAGFDGVLGTEDDIFGSEGIIRSGFNNDFLPDPERGVHPQVTKRHAPTNIGAAYFTELFWDGRASDTFRDPIYGNVIIPAGGALESQALGPIVTAREMAKDDRSWLDVERKVEYILPMHLAQNLPPDIAAAMVGAKSYGDLFERAFGDPTVTAARIAMALAAYQRSLVPDETPYDQFMRGDASALTAEQQAGLALFVGKARCHICHPAPLFGSSSFRNIGLRPPQEDLGRYARTQDPADRGRFRVQTLRNVGLRTNYMHDGRMQDLDEVIDFFDRGGDFADNRDPAIVPLGLTATEKAQLKDFLHNGLTDPRVQNELPPFDRPTLHTSWRDTDSWLYGHGTPGTGGFTPEVIALTPAAQGNDGFRLGVRNGLGGAIAIYVIGSAKQEPPLYVGPIPIHVSVSPLFPILQAHLLKGSGPGQGYATFKIAIPKEPFFLGTSYAVQWLVSDPEGLGGFASTEGASMEVF